MMLVLKAHQKASSRGAGGCLKKLSLLKRLHVWLAYRLVVRKIMQVAARGEYLYTFGVSSDIEEPLAGMLKHEGFYVHLKEDNNSVPKDLIVVGWMESAEQFADCLGEDI